jgi:acetylornithine/succinyldiaminopimelate/putrescine aminotransferase
MADHATQSVMDLEREYLLQNYARYPLVLARGKGCYVYDPEGRRYLDFITGIGVNALGHAHPRIVKTIREQAARLIHSSNLYYHPYQGQLAKRLAEMSGLQRAFFCNSGTEAVEGALKMGPRDPFRKVRDCLIGELFSWTHIRRALRDRSGQISQRFRASTAWCKIRADQ